MKYEKYAERTKKMNPIDDDFFKKMAEDVSFCEETIQTILGDKSIKVIEVKSQNYVKNLQGRSVVLDAHCISEKKGHINVEVQKADDDDHQKRVRYNSACVTANITDTGVRFEKVPDVCSIYITQRDFFKGKQPIYHVERRIRETGEVVDNGYREIYVNAQIKDGSAVSELMRIYTEDGTYDYVNFPATSKRKHYFKEEEKGVSEMCKIMQEIKEEGIKEGIQAFIEAAKEWNHTYEAIKEKIMEKFKQSEEEADGWMKMYWE